ncbi:MAG: hypothetical protein CMD58_02030 [Gammaproteobacteria bacterium]|nr:hypothetical protein [Gammaproteobacteria bacterium]
MHVIAAKAVCFKEALEPEFKEYIKQVIDNAKIMAKVLMSNGIEIVTNGTENHIILVDLRNKGISGKDLEIALGEINITVNKNSVPNDPRSPFITSGIRIGTPAVTTRGFKENEVTQVSRWISEIINDFNNLELRRNIKKEVQKLTSNFPVYNL